MTPLASPQALADRMGRSFDPTDMGLLDRLADASALFRAATGQVISEEVHTDQELRGNWTPRLWLPQKPVTALGDVKIRYSGDTVYSAPIPGLTSSSRGLVLGYSDWGGPQATILASYSSGYAEIPEDIQAVVLAWAVRMLNAPTGQVVASRTLGSAAVTYFSGDSGSVGLTAYEEKVITKYGYQESW